MIANVKIGSLSYEVNLVEGLKDTRENADPDTVLHGEVKWVGTQININADQKEDLQLVTLWHEILHAISTKAGFLEDSEPVFIALSHGIVEVLQDNPELVRLTENKAYISSVWDTKTLQIPYTVTSTPDTTTSYN